MTVQIEQPVDLLIRNGLVFDGRGGGPRQADVAIQDGKIVAIGNLTASGREQIDASGCIVTPGFVDIHTHYDGQAIWSERLSPSSSHGVTTVVIGNCGVGFAPCRREDRDLLISSMEGVEDIPEVVMTAGLTWEWETFPEFLDALAARRHDIDIGAYLPHSPLRVYVMGQRGATREQATGDDIQNMAAIVREAVRSGAVGFATSNLAAHRRGDGEFIPSFRAGEEELKGIAYALKESGGIFQMVPPLPESDELAANSIELLGRIATETGITTTFTLAQSDRAPNQFREILARVNTINEAGGPLKPQIFPRPIGMLIGHNLSVNPFSFNPSYQSIAHLPLADRLNELRLPALRARLISEQPNGAVLPILQLARNYSQMFELGDPPNYEPTPESSISARAARLGVSPAELAYDMLLGDNGYAFLYIAAANYSYGNLSNVFEMMKSPNVILGLGDGGAHYGLICDASYPTFVLTHLTRDRQQERMPLATAISALSSQPAKLIGFYDRGILDIGYKADINVIDYDNLRLNKPSVVYDLPAGGRRLTQTAEGYRATIVSGKIIARNGVPTGNLPGKLVRGTQRLH